uniref:Sorting nexin 3 n=1 Tax=Ornithorhynchus anatinus TaxID=9258 RepID=K7EEK2_ORNAN
MPSIRMDLKDAISSQRSKVTVCSLELLRLEQCLAHSKRLTNTIIVITELSLGKDCPRQPADTNPETNLPIFKLKESSVRRRYSDFEWLRSELERESKVVVPPLPGKAFLRQLPFRGDDGIFDDSFIEERKQGLEQFINKVAGHPLAQNERCLHMFLQDEIIDKSYTPSKIRHA